tara:strand:- start:1257 stop:2585 length:1329 start_codon:yes stop_codon:yes gene_type:complete
MLLVEYTVLDKLQVINEGTKGNKRLKVVGKFQKCDEQNNNGRVYPRKILESQVKAIQEKIGERSLVGALDHPANDAIHLSQASHLVTKLWVEKNGDVMGEAEILSTPNGKIVEALLQDDVKIGISSRGLGSVSEGTTGKVVNEDFKLITFDLVSDPSTKGAFPSMTESMRENSQRAQEIVSKHKKDRVLITMLESKIKEALREAKPTKYPKILKAGEGYGKGLGGGPLAPAEKSPVFGTSKKAKLRQKKKAAKKATDTDNKGNTKPRRGIGKFKDDDAKRQHIEGFEPLTDATKVNNSSTIKVTDDPAPKRDKPPFIPIAGSIHGRGQKPITPAEQRNAEKRARNAASIPDSTEIVKTDRMISFKESISKAVNTYLSELNRSERHEVEQGSKTMDDISLGRDRRHTIGKRHSPKRKNLKIHKGTPVGTQSGEVPKSKRVNDK